MVLVSETADEPQFFSLQLRDTTSEARREGLETARLAIRDRIDQGQPVQGTLDEICRMVESQLDWALGAVMRVRAGGLELAAGERLPPLLESALRSVAMDPSGVPCARGRAKRTRRARGRERLTRARSSSWALGGRRPGVVLVARR